MKNDFELAVNVLSVFEFLGIVIIFSFFYFLYGAFSQKVCF